MRDDDIARAIRQRDITAIVSLMFESPSSPVPKPGFRQETQLWDYKSDCPRPGQYNENSWADLSKDVLGFHNQQGGIILFGITNAFLFCGCTVRLGSKMVNDQLRKYLGDRIWVEYTREFIQPDQRYLGVCLIPPRGPRLERFRTSAPAINGKRLFEQGGSALRDNDSTRVLSEANADALSRKLSTPTLGKVYAIDEPYYRILQPDYHNFVYRTEPCTRLEKAIKDPRSYVSSIVGIGGCGKTALATWCALRSYDRREFDYIVSITAKDRELTASGISALDPGLTSFHSL